MYFHFYPLFATFKNLVMSINKVGRRVILLKNLYLVGDANKWKWMMKIWKNCNCPPPSPPLQLGPREYVDCGLDSAMFDKNCS